MANKDINTEPTAAKADIQKTDQLFISDGGVALKKAAISDIEKVINGETSLSGIGDGTVTGAISALNSKLCKVNIKNDIECHSNITVQVASAIIASGFCVLEFNFTVSDTISTGNQLIKNIPSVIPATNGIPIAFLNQNTHDILYGYVDRYASSSGGTSIVNNTSFPAAVYRGVISLMLYTG